MTTGLPSGYMWVDDVPVGWLLVRSRTGLFDGPPPMLLLDGLAIGCYLHEFTVHDPSGAEVCRGRATTPATPDAVIVGMYEPWGAANVSWGTAPGRAHRAAATRIAKQWSPGRVRVEVRQPVAEAGIVSPATAPYLARWCGGWATDELRWSELMHCYRYPDGHTDEIGGRTVDMGGAMFPTWGDDPVPGGVMLRYGVIAAPGDWIIEADGNHVRMSADEAARTYHLPPGTPQAPAQHG